MVAARCYHHLMPAPARILAFDILRRVESGAWASDLLLAHSAALDPRDASLGAEIVFGVLRFRAQLDYLIEHYSARRQKLDAEVRIALRMAIYQLRYLERVPPHAAVTDSVDLVKRARKRSATGFVNAILRQVDRDPVAWPTREIELSCPEWLLARWERQFGPESAASIARAALQEPEKYTRAGRTQDIGSQSIVPLLQLAPGQSFLDLCAAPGNKTAQALESGVRVTACDLHLHRIAQLKNLTPNLVVLDGTQPLPFARPFDRILLDAPCAGAGTGGVEEDAIERTGKGEGLGAVEDHEVGGEVLELGDAMQVEIAGGDANAGFEGLGGLVAGGGTKIEEGLAGGELEQGDDGLRTDVLGAAGAGVFFGLLDSGAGDG